MLRIRDLLPYMRPLVFETDALTGEQALSLTRVQGVSSVAIVNGGGRRAVGVVHRKHLYEHHFDHGSLPALAKEICRSAPEACLDDPLEEALRSGTPDKYVLVKGDNGVYSHVVTSRVIADFWMDYAAPFSHLDQTESLLRAVVGQLGEEALFETCRARSADQLNPRDYATLFEVHWKHLPLVRLDKQVVLRSLVRFAEFRNRVMHFRLRSDVGDDASDLTEELRHLAALRATLGALGSGGKSA
jgi:hypothetical protein